MKQSFYFLLIFIIVTTWSSCRKDFDFEPSTGNLEFSRDTVYLDTVFTNIGSSTYNLKVYNRSNKDIVIPSIRLSNGYNSYYRMNIDGQVGISDGTDESLGKIFENVELLAKDSMYIFIETTIDIESLSATDNQFLYTDAIEFDSGQNLQKVELVTLVKDAIFIYPDKNSEGVVETLTFDVDGDGNADETEIQGRFLTNDELHFTNEKPYVIYGYAAVGSGQTLTVDPGARIHFHANSGLIVTTGGSLQINGELSNNQEMLENEVIIQGDRLEPLFKDIPGQWGTIWLYNGSINNSINYTTIKNASVGLLVEGNQNEVNNKLTITNSQIYNSSNYGILGRATSIFAENLVINNSGQSSFAGTYGGKYNFTHCTITNYWSNSFRQFPALYLNNYFIDSEENIFTNNLEEANFNNCIIYGNDNPEFILEEETESDFNFKFTNCLLRFQNTNNFYTNSNYDFEDELLYENVVFNQNPDFLDTENNKMNIGESSAAKAMGSLSISTMFNHDILGTLRTMPADIGAYQHVLFEED